MLIFVKYFDNVKIPPQQIFYLSCRAVPKPQPNNLWRIPEHQTEVVHIRVFRDNQKIVVFSVIPNYRVINRFHTYIPDVNRIGKKVDQKARQLERQVFVKR